VKDPEVPTQRTATTLLCPICTVSCWRNTSHDRPFVWAYEATLGRM